MSENARIKSQVLAKLALTIVVAGALLAGLGGGLFAGGFTYVSPDQFAFAESIVFLTMALLGGVGSPAGAVIGTGLLILIPEWLRFLKEIPGLYLAIYGLAVILIVVFMPEGIWGFLGDQVKRLKELEAENTRLRRAVSDLTIEKLILREAAQGNW